VNSNYASQKEEILQWECIPVKLGLFGGGPSVIASIVEVMELLGPLLEKGRGLLDSFFSKIFSSGAG